MTALLVAVVLLASDEGETDEDAAWLATVEAPAPPRGVRMFVTTVLDKQTAWVGEQLTVRLVLFSLDELASVDKVGAPAFNGFISAKQADPTELQPVVRPLGKGTVYAHLIRRRELFAFKTGPVVIDAAEAWVRLGPGPTGRTVHVSGAPVTVTVKPLPPEAEGLGVGQVRLSYEMDAVQTPVGVPLQVRVVLAGRGSLSAIALPRPIAPPGLKLFDPVPSSAPGRRVDTYDLVANQAGTFVLPPLAVRFFDPETARVETTRTDALRITSLAPPGEGPLPPTAEAPSPARFLVGGAALALAASLAVWRLARSRGGPRGDEVRATRVASSHLAAAQQLRASGDAAAFYDELERALSAVTQARFAVPLADASLAELDGRLSTAGAGVRTRACVAAALERIRARDRSAAGRTQARDAALAALEALQSD